VERDDLRGTNMRVRFSHVFRKSTLLLNEQKQGLGLHHPIPDIVNRRLVGEMFDAIDGGITILGLEAALVGNQTLIGLNLPAGFIEWTHGKSFFSLYWLSLIKLNPLIGQRVDALSDRL